MTLMIGFIALVVLLVLGVPVLYCFGAVIVYFAVEFGYSAMALFPTMYGKLASVTLMCIPMFIMALLAEDAEYRAATVSNMGTGLLFAALGVFVMLRQTAKDVSGSKFRVMK